MSPTLCLIQAIDNGTARKIAAASFRDGAEDEFVIDFYELASRLYRVSYNMRNTCTAYSEITGEDLELFQVYHPELRT